jgi:hypothetical protein
METLLYIPVIMRSGTCACFINEISRVLVKLESAAEEQRAAKWAKLLSGEYGNII